MTNQRRLFITSDEHSMVREETRFINNQDLSTMLKIT